MGFNGSYPSGKRLHSHEKSPFLISKPSISMGHLYHGKLLNNQMVHPAVFRPRIMGIS